MLKAKSCTIEFLMKIKLKERNCADLPIFFTTLQSVQFISYNLLLATIYFYMGQGQKIVNHQ